MTPTTHKPLTPLHVRPAIETSLFDFFKIGPGPSSSHTIGPMRAGHDFVLRCDALDPDLVRRAARIHVVLLGSLSATGMGHGTNTAVLAGLLRTSPETCPAGLLDTLGRDADARHELRIHDVPLQVGLADIEHGPIIHDAPYSNTLRVSLEDAGGRALFSMEYYSVGGGFIQWKGWTPPERGKPVHPYGTMRQLREQLARTGLTLHELILDNESAITGMSRPDIFQNLEQIMESMYASVRRGLEAEGRLPGTLGVWRKGHTLLERAREMPLAVDRFLGQVNAYAFAVAEENASGGVIVTAPTCGAAGVMPALLYAMRYNMNIGDRALREGVLASAWASWPSTTPVSPVPRWAVRAKWAWPPAWPPPCWPMRAAMPWMWWRTPPKWPWNTTWASPATPWAAMCRSPASSATPWAPSRPTMPACWPPAKRPRSTWSAWTPSSWP